LISTRSRRAILLFLILLTIVVLARIASSAEGAVPAAAVRNAAPRPGIRDAARATLSMRLDERGTLLPAGTTVRRTLAIEGLRAGSGAIELGWEARLGGGLAAQGSGLVVSPGGGPSRVVLTIPVPHVDGPSDMELKVEAREAGAVAGSATFPFIVLPALFGKGLADLFERAHVGLYDPERRAAPALGALGLHWEDFPSFEGLALFQGDLIVVGPGGFARGREALGPILAARARSGMRLLLLEQPSLPGTLSEDLRLWPSFTRSAGSSALVASNHPVLRGIAAAEWQAETDGSAPPVRPLLPPTRGNFTVISEIRVPTGSAWQEGVTILEFPLGAGLVLAAQESLCADFPRNPRARIVLANALDYLLGDRHGLKRTFLYGASLDDLPACLGRLSPGATPAPADLAGVEALLVPGDWRAPRLTAVPGLPRLAEVARYLREGGTVVLFNPQPMSLDYLRSIVGAPVYFDASSPFRARLDTGASIFQGIALDDLDPLWREGRPEFRLRALPGTEGAQPVALVPGIAEYRVGGGTLVALSLPEAGECAAPRISSLLARLLTNLGIPLDHAPGSVPAVALLDE